jgi:hypothetical protein
VRESDESAAARALVQALIASEVAEYRDMHVDARRTEHFADTAS